MECDFFPWEFASVAKCCFTFFPFVFHLSNLLSLLHLTAKFLKAGADSNCRKGDGAETCAAATILLLSLFFAYELWNVCLNCTSLDCTVDLPCSWWHGYRWLYKPLLNTCKSGKGLWQSTRTWKAWKRRKGCDRLAVHSWHKVKIPATVGRNFSQIIIFSFVPHLNLSGIDICASDSKAFMFERR